MKDVLLTISGKAKEFISKDTPMGTPTKECSITERLMAKGFTFGRMESYMMESGKRVLNMAQECGKVVMAILTLEAGMKVKQRDMELTFGEMGTNTKASGLIA